MMKPHMWSLGLVWWLSLTGASASPEPLVAPVPQPLTAVPGLPGLDLTNAPGPRIQFDTLLHDFGRISSGAVVKHTFVFTNTGDATLNVSHVAASCGCTTAGDWTRKVEPGQTGSIPIQFNSGNFNGVVFKTITVMSDDKKQPNALLQIKADIWKPVEVSPGFAVLHANVETLASAKASVRVLNHEDTPLALLALSSSNPLFEAEIRTNQPGRDFEVLINVTSQVAPTNLQGVISIKTTSTNAPVLNVTAMVALQPALVAAPAQVYLPPAPLVGARAVAVSIMNNGTNKVVLSDAEVNATNVTVDIKETSPGTYFNLNINLPDGFALPAGQSATLTVKSSHPQFPVIRVPIFQPARPTPAPARPVSAAVAAPPPSAVPPQPVAPRPLTRPPGVSRPALSPPTLPPLPGDLSTNAVSLP